MQFRTAMVGVGVHLSQVVREINTLPPETLSQIFLIATELDPPFVTTSVRNDIKTWRLGWISVTHVCHRWRQIALNHAALWSRLSFSIPHIALNEMFVRSKDAPLDLSAQEPHLVRFSRRMGLTSLLSFLEPKHVPRVRSLQLRANIRSHTSPCSILDMFSEPAPLLEVVFAYAQDQPNPEVGTSFTLNQPRLRELHLENVFITSWAGPQLPRLVNLSVKFIVPPYPSQHLPTMKDILEVLRSAPPLKRIAFRGVPARAAGLPDYGTLDIDPVPLSGLETMVLSGCRGADSLRLSSLLQLPPSANVQVTSDSGRPLRTQLRLLSLREHEFGPMRRFVLNMSTSRFILEFRQQEQLCVLPSTPFVLKVTEVYTPDSGDTMGLVGTMQIFASSLSLQGLRYIQIHCIQPVPHSAWTTFFGTALGVEEVSVIGTGSVDALLLELAQYTPEGNPVVFPALKTIGITGAPLDEQTETASGPPALRGEVFFRAVEERRDRGRALELYKVRLWPPPFWTQKATSLGLRIEAQHVKGSG
ncbi:hypothetical protein BC834DRAFT_891516 [Gloeopeniophorella convolvens]|nr:hypothetical protein BC834DRAFT_891516 [Gloeopeniophorella convolvens]